MNYEKMCWRRQLKIPPSVGWLGSFGYAPHLAVALASTLARCRKNTSRQRRRVQIFGVNRRHSDRRTQLDVPVCLLAFLTRHAIGYDTDNDQLATNTGRRHNAEVEKLVGFRDFRQLVFDNSVSTEARWERGN